MDNGIEYIKKEINKINWLQYETAYSATGEKIAIYLKELFCEDKERILEATHMLWCSLCHQHAYISSAALPSYEFLKYALLNFDDYIKIEILDIFAGYAVCIKYNYYYSINKSNEISWIYQLKIKLTNDIKLFEDLASYPNEDISYFAKSICEYIK